MSVGRHNTLTRSAAAGRTEEEEEEEEEDEEEGLFKADAVNEEDPERGGGGGGEGGFIDKLRTRRRTSLPTIHATTRTCAMLTLDRASTPRPELTAPVNMDPPRAPPIGRGGVSQGI